MSDYAFRSAAVYNRGTKAQVGGSLPGGTATNDLPSGSFNNGDTITSGAIPYIYGGTFTTAEGTFP